MRLTFLGTSAGTPTRARNVSGLAIAHNGEWDLFDCGEGTQHQILATSLTLPKLRRIFISHLHGDHCLGLFGLLGSRSMSRATTPVDIYGPAGLKEMTRAVLRTTATHLTYPVAFHVVDESGGPVVEDTGETVTAIALDHPITSFAWHLKEAERPGKFDVERATELGLRPGPDFAALQNGEPVVSENGTRIEPSQVLGPSRPGRSVIVAGDNRDPMLLLTAARDADVLVHEATYTEDVLANLDEDFGHSTAARVAAMAQRAGVRNLVLTHFSPRFTTEGEPPTIAEIETEASSIYDGNVVLAHDLGSYELSADGELS